MLCRHKGKAGVDCGLREDTAGALCGGSCTRRHVGVPAGRSTQETSFLHDIYLDAEDL